MTPSPAKTTCIEDLRRTAKRKLPKMFYEYIDTGSWTESTYRANSNDFSEIKFRQRVLVDMENRSLKTQMLGQDVSMPLALSPTGLTGMFHADGEILAARACEKFGVPYTLSTMSICSIEDVAENTSAPFWFQLYVMRDREFMADLIRRAKAAQCSALVLTADLQMVGQRHRDIKNGLSVSPKPTLANILNFAIKPEWCLKMLNTQRRTFRNIVGHAKDVTGLADLMPWVANLSSKAFWTPKMPNWPCGTARMPLSCPTTAGGSWTARYPASAPCPTWCKPQAAKPKYGWTAASARGRICSKHGHWAHAA